MDNIYGALIVMMVGMLYLIKTYPNNNYTKIICLLGIDWFIVANISELYIEFAIFCLLINTFTNFHALLINFENTKN